jgi:hypothetical protein
VGCLANFDDSSTFNNGFFNLEDKQALDVSTVATEAELVKDR